MNLANVCIKRPVFTLMINAALIVLGYFSYQGLGLDLFPKIDNPSVRISTDYPGASPEELESEIVRVIEEAVNTISGIDTISARCEFGNAMVSVVFNLEKNIDVGAQEIRDKIARVMNKLPKGIDPPSVEKVDPDASPVLTLVVSGKMPMRELTFFAKKRIQEPLETINGVGAIQIVGEKNRAIQVVLDAGRLAALNISADQVKTALQNQNMEVPGGNVTNGDYEYVLRNLGRIRSTKEFVNIIVAEREGRFIRVQDLGTVVDDVEEIRSLAWLDGESCLSLTIQKQSGCNTLDVINQIKNRITELQKSFPSDLKILYIRDQSEFIKASMHELNLHLVMGSFLASLVVLLFMRNLVSTFIAALAIPVSLISTFIFMKLMGFTLNNMTMLGMTLAVGIVIDDAIVVLENIFRHIEERGSDAMTASSEATSEIALAVMATSLSLAVIFVPVIFISGIIGNLLSNFGLTIAFSILVSIFVSFTLTPMMCSQLFRFKIARGHGGSKNSWFFLILERVYGSLLRFSLRRRWVILLIAGLCLASIVPLYSMSKVDFLPTDDSGEYQVSIKMPQGSSMRATERVIREIEGKLRKLPGAQHFYTQVGGGGGTSQVTEGSIYVQLVDLSKRNFSQADSMVEARKIMKEYQQYDPSVQNGGVQVMGGGGKDFMFYVRGPDLEKLKGYTNSIVENLRKCPIFGNVSSSFIDRKPEIHVKVDRDRAFQAGIRVDTVFLTLKTLVGGMDQISQYQDGDEQYEVRVRLRPEDRTDVRQISKLLLPTGDGNCVTLDSLASVTTGFGPAQINRQDRQRSISVSGTLGKGRGLGEANEYIVKTIREMNLPVEYSFGFGGKAKEMERTYAGYYRAFSMSAIFMFLILASQFESFLHPLTIMLSLPLSIPFALVTLLIARGFLPNCTLNVYSGLGVFMLFGIVKKNAILQIDYTNTLREQGMERDKAVYEANQARLRPILMTTVTLVAGMLPMALGTGPGSATRASMAIVIIGGQSLCLLITLLVTPVAYTLFDDLMIWIRSVLPRMES
ncbi:MAG: efflux RND transporter permease subunit [Candidatus Riflebacteria bacterium]|nr:efflux RND transporter permease subunit [Candidatus Riflebacteria bacterium]